jgi:hypothetical protein
LSRISGEGLVVATGRFHCWSETIFGLTKETRNELHRFFFWACAAVVTFSIGFYRGVIKEDHKQQVVYL